MVTKGPAESWGRDHKTESQAAEGTLPFPAPLNASQLCPFYGSLIGVSPGLVDICAGDWSQY